jgi:hypothetical protein
MKTTITECADAALEFVIEPETVEEMTILARYAANASADKPLVRFSFRGEPYLYMFLKKRKPSCSTAKFSIEPK